jgi:uncharacterized protein (TIGR02145 family)
MKKNITLITVIFIYLHSWSQTKITNSTSLISSYYGFDAASCLNDRYIQNPMPGQLRYNCEGGTSGGVYNNILFFDGDIDDNDYVIVDFQAIKNINYIKLIQLSTGLKRKIRAGRTDEYIFLQNTFGYSIQKSTTPNGPWLDVSVNSTSAVYPTNFQININQSSRFWKITFKTPLYSLDICEPDFSPKDFSIYLQQIDFYETVVPSPTGSVSQSVCYGATLANLTVTGSTIKWYSSPSGGSLLPSTTLINNGTTYYASQTINGFESIDRLAITATQNISAPTGLSPQSLANGLTLSAIQVVGSNVKWYANQSNANQHINPLPGTTLLVNGNTYYATQTVNGCESTSSLDVVINLTMGLTDVDGNIYNTVDICNKTYMKENLNVSKYKNGDIIPGPLTATEWANTSSGAWKWYNSDDSGYGKLYNWYAVNDPRGLAPEGWHIPSSVEWEVLSDCLGGSPIAGTKMKEVGNLHWVYPNGTNESGFTALPGGLINSGGQNTLLGYYCYFWSSSYGLGYLLYPYDAYFSVEGSESNNGYSVRCMKNSNLSNEIFKNTECFLSPNPTHSVINISLNNGIILDKVIVVDITGKVVLEQTENLSTINVEKLAKGVYILTANAGDNKYQEKFIKE